jgi:hypothetical protein
LNGTPFQAKDTCEPLQDRRHTLMFHLTECELGV